MSLDLSPTYEFLSSFQETNFRLKPVMNPALAAALPGLGDDFFVDEFLVNSLWNSILTSTFPSTGAPGSFLVYPEMIKGTRNQSSVADLAVMQISNTNPAIIKKSALYFEGKSSESDDTWASIKDQIVDWTAKAMIGQLGGIWGLGAKGHEFLVIALDRKRDD